MFVSLKRLFCTTAVIVLLASPTFGGPLVDDPGSTLMSGSQVFNGGFNFLKSRVEYAVFAPGDFGSYAPLGSPAAYDPSGGTEFVYAYEIFNDQGGSTGVALLSINLLEGVVGIDPAIPDTLPISGGVEPSATEFIPVAGNPKTNIKWTFAPTAVGSNGHSEILLFTSSYLPEFRDATVSGAFPDSASGLLPSPSSIHTPEPSTLVLAVVAAIGLLAAGYRRRRKV
jgi:hypothetical protein